MRSVLPNVLVTVACFLLQSMLGVAVAQENRLGGGAGDEPGTTTTKTLGAAGGVLSLGLTGERRPLYQIAKSDVLEVNFTFAPEFDQTVTVQPDGFVVLKGVGSVYADGLTSPELSDSIRRACAFMLKDPEVTVRLKDFDHPFFIASGEVVHPGKYELRSDTTVAEAVAIAGGFTAQAKHSQVVLFRRVSRETVETRVLNEKDLLRNRNLGEDPHLRPGDFVFVPQNTISKLRKYMPLPNLGMYLNPAQF